MWRQRAIFGSRCLEGAAVTEMNLEKKGSLLGKLMVAFILVLLIATSFKLQMDLNTLHEKRQALQTQVHETKYHVERLENDIAMASDIEYIEKIAKEKLNYRNPNEIIFYNEFSD